MSVSFANHQVKVPKGFNYNEIKEALEQNYEVPIIQRECYKAIQLTIQDYRYYVENYLENGHNPVEIEYQTFPFGYTVHQASPVDWRNDSVEDMIHNASFWDSL